MLQFIRSIFQPRVPIRLRIPDMEALPPIPDALTLAPPEAVPEAKSEEVVQLPIEPQEQTVGPVYGLSKHEKSDDYYKVALQINDRWRIIICRDDLQWIVQSRKGTYKNKPAWRAKQYLRSKRGIIKYLIELFKYLPESLPNNTIDHINKNFPDWI